MESFVGEHSSVDDGGKRWTMWFPSKLNGEIREIVPDEWLCQDCSSCSLGMESAVVSFWEVARRISDHATCRSDSAFDRVFGSDFHGEIPPNMLNCVVASSKDLQSCVG